MAGGTWHKYGAKATVIDGITFTSKAEARRYSELKLLERAGEITHLQLQPKFPIKINDTHVCTYIADFSYRSKVGAVVEDVKGMKTPVYRLKKKLVEATYPWIKIAEVE